MPDQKREEIAIIGGGLGGCLTALMLAKDPKYHVTLIEAQDTLLNGASAIASRLHLGGEYPLDPKTASDCLTGATIWKLLMPESIYTPTPPMKFLLAQKTQEYGEKHLEDDKALTLDKYLTVYEKIRNEYKIIFAKVQKGFGWNDETTKKSLFGSFEEGKFSRPLKPEEYGDYNQGHTKIAGGFQSQELGLNVPKYLAMIQTELEAQERKGNIAVLTSHKVRKKGIKGNLGNFTILREDGEYIKDENGKPKIFKQVVQAAWRGGPEITPQLGQSGNQGRTVTVFKRAMLLVDLPPGWKTPPAFIMLGENGGMLAPHNDKTAICYLPTEQAAYRKHYMLTNKDPALPEDWDRSSEGTKTEWTETYFRLLKNRFPVLKNATNPRLVIRDTLNFQQDLHQRQHQAVLEVTSGAPIVNMSMGMFQQQEMQQWSRPPIVEVKRGLFTLYPTKATYSLQAALQAAAMVNTRSHDSEAELIYPPEDTLGLILSPEKREQYSLARMQEPNIRFFVRFFREHPELVPAMLQETWPMEPAVETLWAQSNSEEQVSRRKGGDQTNR